MDLRRATVRLGLSSSAGASAGAGSDSVAGAGSGARSLSDALGPRVRAQGQGSRSRSGSGSEAHPRSDTTSLAEYGRVVSDQRGSHCQRVSRNLVSSLTERFSMVCRAQGAGQAQHKPLRQCKGWSEAVSVPGVACGQRCSAAAQRTRWSGFGVHEGRESSREGLWLCVREVGVRPNLIVQLRTKRDHFPFWVVSQRSKTGRF